MVRATYEPAFERTHLRCDPNIAILVTLDLFSADCGLLYEDPLGHYSRSSADHSRSILLVGIGAVYYTSIFWDRDRGV